MAYNGNITTSKHGRRLGLQLMSTVQTGGNRGAQEFLVGPEAFRVGVTTDDSTSVNIHPFGISMLDPSSAASSQVYTLDPPIPGVQKIIYGSTSAAAYIKTANSELIKSTVGATQTVIALPAAGHTITLTGVTTALWLTETATASGINLTNTT